MKLADRIRFLLITSGGLGLSPVVPGTVGTLGGVLLAVVLQLAVPEQSRQWLPLVWFGVGAVLFAWGCTTTAFVQRVFQREDPGPFVLDEVVGYLVTVGLFAVLLRTPTPADHAAAFLLFRVFDVVKVQPARRLEELPGALGIMADDVMAGLYAGASMRLLQPLLGW